MPFFYRKIFESLVQMKHLFLLPLTNHIFKNQRFIFYELLDFLFADGWF